MRTSPGALDETAKTHPRTTLDEPKPCTDWVSRLRTQAIRGGRGVRPPRPPRTHWSWIVEAADAGSGGASEFGRPAGLEPSSLERAVHSPCGNREGLGRKFHVKHDEKGSAAASVSAALSGLWRVPRERPGHGDAGLGLCDRDGRCLGAFPRERRPHGLSRTDRAFRARTMRSRGNVRRHSRSGRPLVYRGGSRARGGPPSSGVRDSPRAEASGSRTRVRSRGNVWHGAAPRVQRRGLRRSDRHPAHSRLFEWILWHHTTKSTRVFRLEDSISRDRLRPAST